MQQYLKYMRYVEMNRVLNIKRLTVAEDEVLIKINEL